jgi:nucleoside-diphosphate-sugar epimerase
MKKKVLITGCNGFIGKNLFPFLESLDYEVFGIDINCSDSVNKFNIDINIYDDLYKILKYTLPEIVINLAARIDISDDSIWEYKTNIFGVQNLIKATEEVESIKRVIWTSTQLVNKLGSNFIDYNFYNANTTYGASKVIGEQLVKNSVHKKEWVIVRPSTVWGPGMSNHYFNFIKYIDKGIYFNITRNKVYKSFSYIGNTCFQIEKIICTNSELINRRSFYLSDYNPLELHEWTNDLSFALNRRKLYSVPIFISYLIASIFLILKTFRLINKVPVSFYNINNILTNYINNNDLEAITGPLPFNIKEGVRNTIKWYKSES